MQMGVPPLLLMVLALLRVRNLSEVWDLVCHLIIFRLAIVGVFVDIVHELISTLNNSNCYYSELSYGENTENILYYNQYLKRVAPPLFVLEDDELLRGCYYN